MANLDKKTVFLKEYKEGFSEIQKLVESFDEIETDSQEVFIRERRNILKQQLEFVEGQRIGVFNYLRGILAKANSRLNTLTDMEVFITNALEQCDQTEKQLLNPDIPEALDAAQN